MLKAAAVLAVLLAGKTTAGFQQVTPGHRPRESPAVVSQCRLDATSSPDSSFLLDDFKTATGEIIDPYEVLKVSRDAERSEIRQQYRAFSRKYHPDGMRYNDVLPGSW